MMIEGAGGYWEKNVDESKPPGKHKQGEIVLTVR
jgi:hypothetical protein